MRNIRFCILLTALLFGFVAPVAAELRIGIGVPHVSIRLSLPFFPELVPVPGFPVYYAPRLEANYFFYDGYYWVYSDDNWYASEWYNGPWWLVDPFDVPLFILRIPIGYYRLPPPYFYDWPSRFPPRWGHRWGHDWERQHPNWDHWDRNRAPAPAPLPHYQRDYAGKRYPRGEEQQRLRQRFYRYEPRDRGDIGQRDRGDIGQRDRPGSREQLSPGPSRRDDDSPLRSPRSPSESRGKSYQRDERSRSPQAEPVQRPGYDPRRPFDGDQRNSGWDERGYRQPHQQGGESSRSGREGGEDRRGGQKRFRD